MISDLAQKSVTFVIAHRLRTLEDATLILDLSIEEPDSELKLYTKNELMLKSNYYRELISGQEQL